MDDLMADPPRFTSHAISLNVAARPPDSLQTSIHPRLSVAFKNLGRVHDFLVFLPT